jgi:hypothetical protein
MQTECRRQDTLIQIWKQLKNQPLKYPKKQTRAQNQRWILREILCGSGSGLNWLQFQALVSVVLKLRVLLTENYHLISEHMP